MEAAVNALCSALFDINSAIHLQEQAHVSLPFIAVDHITYAIVNGTALPPIEDTM